jgi:ribonuclease T2
MDRILTVVLLVTVMLVAGLLSACQDSGSLAQQEDGPPTAISTSQDEQPGGELVMLPEEPESNAAPDANSNAVFAYYVLALSWSPQHCATPAGQRDDVQCRGPRSFGFVAHGLWPQHERGWPQDCASPHSLPQSVITKMMDIMPSAGLIRHQWRKHGTCSGLTPEDYFAATRKAFDSFAAPEGYGTPDSTLNVSPAVYKQAVLAANPALNDQNTVTICSGRFLQEVRICLDKELRPRRCGSGVRDRCNVPEMIVRPLR